MATVSLIRPEPRAAHSLSGEQLSQEAAARLGARWSSRSEDLEHTMEQQNKDHSQPAEGQQRVQERRQVRLREQDRDSSVTGWHGEHQGGNGAGASWPAGPEHLQPGHSYSQTWGFSMKSRPPRTAKARVALAFLCPEAQRAAWPTSTWPSATRSCLHRPSMRTGCRCGRAQRACVTLAAATRSREPQEGSEEHLWQPWQPPMSRQHLQEETGRALPWQAEPRCAWSAARA